MTWSARVSRDDGSFPKTINDEAADYSACMSCKHEGSCYVAKTSDNIAYVLTSVDTGCDGHMASGEALLKCNGYEEKGNE